MRPVFCHADPAAHWRQRLDDGLAHVLGLVIAKAVHGQLAAGVPPPDVVRQVALFGIQNRDGWGDGLTILTALGNLLPVLPEEETYLALFQGARRVAADCDGQAPRRQRVALASRPDLATLKRWLRRWTAVTIARQPSALCSPLSPPAPHQLRSPTSCLRPIRTARSPTEDTRLISQTKPSSAST